MQIKPNGFKLIAVLLMLIMIVGCGSTSGGGNNSTSSTNQESLISSGPNPSIPGLQVATWNLGFGNSFEIVNNPVNCQFHPISTNSDFALSVVNVDYQNGQVNPLTVVNPTDNLNYDCDGVLTQAEIIHKSPIFMDNVLVFQPTSINGFVTFIPANDGVRRIVSELPTQTFITVFDPTINQFLTVSPNADGEFELPVLMQPHFEFGLIRKLNVSDLEVYPVIGINERITT